jgi:hypothetical protein
MALTMSAFQTLLINARWSISTFLIGRVAATPQPHLDISQHRPKRVTKLPVFASSRYLDYCLIA